MKIAVFDSKQYDRQALTLANHDYGFALSFFEPRLNRDTVALAAQAAAAYAADGRASLGDGRAVALNRMA